MANDVEFDEEICKVLLDKFQDELAKDLKGYYTWDFEPALNVLDDSIRDAIRQKIKLSDTLQVDSIPNKTIALKQKAKDVMLKDIITQNEIGNEKSWNLYSKFVEWVVKDWGGIKLDVSKNKDKLCELWKKIKTNEKKDGYSDILGFDKISSLSKVASFLDEKKYAVYDSRVAFTLNWLIFINKMHKKDNSKGKMKFFRQPGGQNSYIDRHSQQTIFNIVYRNDNFDLNDDFYYKESETYEIYCSLLKRTCEYCKKYPKKYANIKNNVSIGKLEMCLFSIAADGRNVSKENIYKTKSDDRKVFITDEMDLRLKIERI